MSDRKGEIRARLAAATESTPAPWQAGESVDGQDVGVRSAHRDAVAYCPFRKRKVARAHAALIANAPADLAYLIGEVERLTAEREVGEPPAPGETPHTYTKPAHGWTCFHCGETFKTIGGARDHFGAAPTAMPGCMARVAYGDERGLEMALREAEAALATADAAGFARGVEAAAEWCEASRAELSALDDLSWYDDGRQAAFGLARDAIRALVTP